MCVNVNVNVNVFSLGLSNATEEQQVYSAIWDMPLLQGVCTSMGVEEEDAGRGWYVEARALGVGGVKV